MKKNIAYLALVFFLLISFKGLAQESQMEQNEINQRDIAKNEVGLNVLNILVFGALDVSYERILSPNTSITTEMFSKVFNKNEGEDVDLSKAYAKDFSLNVKFKYFIKEGTNAQGLYAEAFTMFSDGLNEKEIDVTDPVSGETKKREVDLEYQDVALGIGVGGKFVAKQGFLVDASFGLGRNLFHKDSPDIVILPNLSVGYRF